MSDKPRVAVILTGGTIDSIGSSRLDLAWYTEARKRLDAGELLAGVPELAEIADVEEVAFRRLYSSAITTPEWIELAQLVDRLAEVDGFDGVVITHGTNTIEETAYFLHLVLRTAKPVVLVGAMRPSSALSTDGPLNLVRAVQVASDARSAGQGVLVVMNDAIFGARDVTKTATLRVDAFAAPDLGPLGYADADNRVVFYHAPGRPRPAEPFTLDNIDDLPRVDVVVSYIGADGVMIDAAVAAGARGIVSAATGVGHPTPAEDEALDRACAQGVVVCQSSRVGSGRVSRTPSLVRRGIVTADNLRPWKARVLLSLALTKTSDPDQIQDYFGQM